MAATAIVLSAMLLAAGSGTRLMPLTAHTPKALIRVGGQPLLFWHLQALASAGVQRVVINLVADEEVSCQIESAVGDGSRWSLEILLSRQSGRLDSGGDVRQALPLLGEEPFVLINADIHTDYPLERLLAAGQQLDGERALMHMVLAPPAPGKRGDCSLVGDRVGRPGREEAWTWTGMSALHPKLFRDAPTGRFHLWHQCAVLAADAGLVSGEVWRGHWQDAGTHARLANLRSRLDRTGRVSGR